MKTFIKSFAGLFFLGVLITSCSKDDKNDTKSYLKVGGTNYSLNAGVIENYGYDEDYDSYNIDLDFFSSGITIGEDEDGDLSPTGQGTAVYFETYTSDGSELDEGEYQFNDTYAVKTFDYGDYCTNWSNFSSNTWVEFVSGTIKVAKDGDNYEITLNLVDENGNTVKGYFKGPLTYFDYDTPIKSTNPRHKRLW